MDGISNHLGASLSSILYSRTLIILESSDNFDFIGSITSVSHVSPRCEETGVEGFKKGSLLAHISP